ncbi:MAG TPA: translocation/assembly module TamB domain-containing protein, partial [Chitinophagaceae bacterium]|nr:translocation/assembly module TamB domain-containing protein [Chitinophagaceae bacterium]
LRDAGLRVNFTQVYYKIDDTEIELLPDRIDFGTIKLRDRFNNTATARGYIAHEAFSNMQFDLMLKVDSRQMELLNTKYQDNQQFYGRAMGSGTLVLTGPQEEMYMDIDLTASETDSSYITLPPSRTREGGQASFMVERLYGREMTPSDLGGEATNISYNVHMTANPMVNIEVILDELTGDVIRGRGTTEDLFIRGGTSEPLSITGTYAIEEGSYVFTFQSFFKKPFVLRKGGNSFIKWTGDPYDADIRFDAMFQAVDVNFTPLNNTLNVGTGTKNLRDDVNVIAVLTGKLFRPIFNFDLEFPNPTLSNNPGVQFGLQQIKQNPNELNKQVTYLIVFNSFAPIENTSSAGANTLYEFSYNTLSGLLFGEVNKRLNQLLSRILRNNDLSVNFTGSLYNRSLVQNQRGGFNINQGNVNVNVNMPLLNDRFQISFGSTVDIPLQSVNSQVTQVHFLPDVALEWLINKSGSIRATFFYRQNLDFLGSNEGLRTVRSGASIAYRREFDRLFRRRDKKGDSTKAAALPGGTTAGGQ